MGLGRGRARRRARAGQLAIVDGIIFLSLLLLAFFLLMDAFLAPVSTSGQNSSGEAYVRSTLDTLLKSTFPLAKFPLHAGTDTLQDQNAASLLTEATYLIAGGQTTPALLMGRGAVGWEIQWELENLTNGAFGHFNFTVQAPPSKTAAPLDMGAQSTYSPIDMYTQEIGLPPPPGWTGPISVTLEIWNT